MPPKSASGRSSAEAIPVLDTPRKAPSEKKSSQELRRQASEAWKEYEKMTKNMLKHAEVYTTMDDLAKDLALQKEQVATYKNKIQDLETHRSLQMDDFTKKYNEWEKEKEKLELQANNAEKDSAEKYSKEIEELKEKIRGLEDDVKTVKDENQTLSLQLEIVRQDRKEAKDELEIWRQKTKRYEKDLAQLDETPLETHEEEVKSLGERSLRLFYSYFRGDLSESVFANYSEWETQEKALGLHFKLPASNSKAATAVRLAASLYTFAGSLNTISGRSWYNLASANNSETVAKAIEAMFPSNTRKKSLARSLFLSTYQRDELQVAIRNAAASASHNVFKKLKFLVSGDDQTFQSELNKLFQDWADFWLKMQYSKEQVVASLEEEESDLGDAWIAMGEFGDENPNQEDGIQTVPLFPCIYSSETQKIIQVGHYLCLDQELVIAAENEVKRMARARRNAQKGPIRRVTGKLFFTGDLSDNGKGATQGPSSP